MEKKYNFQQMERELGKLWEEQEIYKYQNGKRGKIYSIDTPPPTVSGKLHIGHVFSYTQAEMIARFKRMQGFDVFYPFGFDDNGLPTERLVEKFIALAKQKKAYMKESPVLWCTECQTSIAQAELESKECDTTFNYLNFRTAVGDLLIATTRPELLAGCVSIFVHPQDQRYQNI